MIQLEGTCFTSICTRCSGNVIWFIDLRNIFGIFRLLTGQFQSFQSAPKTGNRMDVALLFEFYPKENQTGMRISAPHVAVEANFLIGMLVCMSMRTSGTVAQGIPGSIVTFFQTLNNRHWFYTCVRPWKHHVFQHSGQGIDDILYLVLYCYVETLSVSGCLYGSFTITQIQDFRILIYSVVTYVLQSYTHHHVT